MKPTAKTSVDGERRARVWFVRVKRRKRRRKRRRRRRWWRRRRRKSRRNAAGSALFFCFPRPPSTLRRKSKLQITNNKKKPIKRTHWPDEPVQPDRKTRSHLKKKTNKTKPKSQTVKTRHSPSFTDDQQKRRKLKCSPSNNNNNKKWMKIIIKKKKDEPAKLRHRPAKPKTKKNSVKTR